jgi:hypothetical protein
MGLNNGAVGLKEDRPVQAVGHLGSGMMGWSFVGRYQVAAVLFPPA